MTLSKTFFLFICLAGYSLGKPSEIGLSCKALEHVLLNLGVTFEDFGNTVGHGVHSLYLEELREFIEPEAIEENGIPVVNWDLASPDTILLNSPLAGYDQTLLSHGFKTMDFVFSNDNPNFMIGMATTVEKLGHAFHMQQVWMEAKIRYDQLKSNPPKDAHQICKCANNINENGVLESLKDVAMTLKKYPGNVKPKENAINIQETATDEQRAPENLESYEGPNCYAKNYYYFFRIKPSTSETKAIHSWYPGTVNSSKGWFNVKSMLHVSMPKEAEHQMLALFLYCKLNNP